jgi:HK97 family phage portal protein
MGFLARAVAEAKGANTVWDRWVQLMDAGGKSKAGPAVTLKSAIRVSAAFACMREISQGLAQVPFKVFKDYEVQRDHPVHKLLTRRPNAWQTCFEFMETLGVHVSLGNAYVFKNQYRGKVAELIILHPSRVRAEQKDDWSITYKVRGMSGLEREIPAADMWHIRGMSWDGFLGLDLLDVAKEALGLSIALEESVSGLHADGVRPSGVYAVDGNLSPEQYAKLAKWLKDEARSPGGALILDRGAKWHQQTMTSVDAQHKEMRQQQIEEVCRFFGILPSIVGFTGDKANTYASAEVMENAHKVRTQGRWYKRLQDSANVNLLTEQELDKGLYTKFITNALMAASAEDRGEFYSKALGAGGSPAFMTQDEVRVLEDLPPMGGEAAKLPPLINKAPAPAPAP